MKKKFLSIAVCLCMIMTMIPGGVLQPDEAWAAEHTDHCICGGSRSSGDHTEHTDITDWKEWTETTYLPNEAGSYYLTQNVEISEAWEPASGTVLCLNGKNITANGRFDAIDVQASVTFTLTDCEPNSTRGNITHAKDSNNAALSGSGVSVKAGAAFNMYGGNITGNEVTIGGSGVSVEAGAAFNMHGGSITKNTALNTMGKGGGVNNYGIFTMTGGTISGNQGGTANGGGGGGVLNAGTFTMSGTAVIGGTNAEDANIGYKGGGVYNYNTGQFNFNGGTIIGNEANKNGGGVYNEQGSSTFTMTGGIIKKNKAKNGGGVAVNNSATFTMNGGTIGDENSDDGNTVTNEGGGVYVLSGIFNMDTGKIIGNTAVGSKTDEYRGWGGGVNNYGIFTMTGGTISSNSAIKEQGSAGALGAGGGIYNNRSGTFTMSGGNISNNTSDSHGGGVYNSGTFTMSDTAAISGNTVTNETCYGGGVFNYSNFTMNGGTIGGLNEGDANTAGFGGGLYHGDGEAQLNGGMIQGNIAAKSGGGVFYTKNITLKNVTITGNTANEDGGGAWMGFVDDAVMTVDGTTTITDNKDKDGKANNVDLRMGKSLTADASLSPSARIGITTLTNNEKTLVKNSTDTKVFTSDMSGYKLIDDGNSGLKLAVDDGSTPTQTGHKHYLCGKTHTEVGDHTSDEETKFTAWTRTDSLPDTAGNYYLTEDVTLTSAVEYRGGIGKDYCGWDVPDGVVLCLNGQNITMKNPDGMTDEVDVIKVSGHFTLTDCKTGDAQGKITHATDASSTKCEGKGVKVLGGTFDMFGGIISGNTTNYDIGGGGVSVEGVSDTTKASIFKLYGGKISGNTAKSGGGVHVRRTVWCGPSEFRMYGGSITNNNADSDAGSYGVGGGVYVSWTSKFVMSGGTISGNTATQNGGGLYASALAKEYASSSGGAATLNVSGNAAIKDNTVDSKKNNVYLDSSTININTVSATLTINNPLTGAIGVTPAEVPVTIATGAESNTDYSTVITSDNTGYEIAHDSDDATKLILKDPNAPIPVKEHKHCVCGEGTLSVESHEHNKEQKWTETKTLTNDMKAGCYYLTDDVILTGKWKPANNVVLCLNGYNIICNAGTYDHSVSAIDIDSNDTLVLTDCHTGSEAGKVTHGKDSSDKRFMGRGVSNHGTFIMYNISIADNDNTSTSFSGGGVENNAGATFTMYNGSITGNKDVNGGGVYNNYGTFNMYGGTISGNTASNNGGGVFNAGNSDSNAVFIMYGGTIKGNTALSTETDSYNGLGGGVCNAGSFNMHGGVVGGTEASDANIASNRGGGIYDGRAYYDSNPVFNISGAANIIGNKVNTKDNNLYLYNQKNTVTVTAAGLEEGARIGVSSCTEPSAENPVVITNKGCNAEYFFSDDNSCEIGSDSDNAVILKKKDITHEHTWDTAWKHNDTYHWHECTDADCTEINDMEKHSGGTATCTEKAVCSVCKEPYGKVSGHDFGGKYKYSAAGHWQECQREGCTATGSITDHIYDNSSDVTCNICGYVRTVKPGTSGKTDNVINKAEDRNAGTAASTTATIKPSTTTSGEKKTTTATVDNTTANKILDKAVSNKSTEVIINTLTRAGISEAQAGTATEIALPEKTVRELSEKTEASLIIRADAAEITLDKKAVDGLAAQAGTDGYVRLIVEIVKQDSNTLEAELKLVTSKGTVTDFKGGNVSVMVKLNDTLAAKDLVCVYIDDSNIYHMVNGAKNSDGTYSFMTGHFSTYAVMARSEAEKVIAEQNADKATELVKSVKLKARSAKTAKGNIRVTLSVANGRDSIKALEDLGYTVKYKYYRSTSRAKNYKSMLEGTGKTYINTAGKKDTKYFYKARLTVYDAQGRLIAKTELKQCRYACRVK